MVFELVTLMVSFSLLVVILFISSEISYVILL